MDSIDFAKIEEKLKGTPFSGQSRKMALAAWQKGIDPKKFLAVFAYESAWGKSARARKTRPESAVIVSESFYNLWIRNPVWVEENGTGMYIDYNNKSRHENQVKEIMKHISLSNELAPPKP